MILVYFIFFFFWNFLQMMLNNFYLSIYIYIFFISISNYFPFNFHTLFLPFSYVFLFVVKIYLPVTYNRIILLLTFFKFSKKNIEIYRDPYTDINNKNNKENYSIPKGKKIRFFWKKCKKVLKINIYKLDYIEIEIYICIYTNI